MVYTIYFSVFFLTLLVTAVMVMLYLKGFRIRYEDKHFHIHNIRNSVKLVTKAVIDVGSNMTSFISPSNEATYSSLKKDFPNFDIDKMKKEIENYLIDYFKDDIRSIDIKSTNTFTNELSGITDKEEINMKSLIILRTIMNKYVKESGLAKIEFNSTLEYNREYGNDASRKIQENYVTEFVHSIPELRKNKKVKCPKCGNEINIVKKSTKCSNCGIDMTEDVWYLNNIRKI